MHPMHRDCFFEALGHLQAFAAMAEQAVRAVQRSQLGRMAAHAANNHSDGLQAAFSTAIG